MTRWLPRAVVLGLGLCWLTASLAHAESLEGLWAAANAAYVRGDLGAAIAQYQRLVDAGVEDADVYYNLGLSHARHAELGEAILAFERAARLAPDDDDTLTALAATKAAAGKRRAERAGEATVETRPPLLEGLVQRYRENALSACLLTLDLLAFALLIGRGRVRGDSLRVGLAVGAATCLLGAALAGGALLVKRGTLDDGPRAIVLHDGAALRDGPDPRAKTRATAYEGARAQVLARDGAFLRVRVTNGPDGWMSDKDVAVIDRRLTR